MAEENPEDAISESDPPITDQRRFEENTRGCVGPSPHHHGGDDGPRLRQYKHNLKKGL